MRNPTFLFILSLILINTAHAMNSNSKFVTLDNSAFDSSLTNYPLTIPPSPLSAKVTLVTDAAIQEKQQLQQLLTAFTATTPAAVRAPSVLERLSINLKPVTSLIILSAVSTYFFPDYLDTIRFLYGAAGGQAILTYYLEKYNDHPVIAVTVSVLLVLGIDFLIREIPLSVLAKLKKIGLLNDNNVTLAEQFKPKKND
jgi:hypothetical protein